MSVLVTVRSRNAQGEILGTFIHPAPYEAGHISVGGRRYVVVGAEEEQGKQTLYVVPPK
jgi:hypothetical protein